MNPFSTVPKALCFLICACCCLAAESYLGEHFDEIHVLTASPGRPCENFRIYQTDKIKIAVSAQFAADHLDQFKEKHGPATIVDCRQETKFFINGHAVTVQKNVHNNSNRGLHKHEVLRLNDLFVKEAEKTNNLTLHEIKKIIVLDDAGNVTEKYAILLRQEEVQVNQAISEPALVERIGLNYVFIPITDHEFDVRDFTLIQQIVTTTLEAIDRSDQAIYFHCKKGVGRSTIAALLALIVIQAKEKSLEEISIELQAGGELYSAELKKLNKHQNFFDQFHRYCKEIDDLRAVSFADWNKTHYKEVYDE